MRRSGILATGAALAGAALLGLTACAPHPAPSSTAHSGSTPSASPSASATPTIPPLPADVLFKISVTATAPNGAVARLTETVHAPVAATDQQSADEAQFDNECDNSWRTAYSPTKFVVAQVSAILVSGTWDPNQVVAADMAGYPVWQGDERAFQAFCASALPNIPGGARAVSPVGGGTNPDTNGGWGIYRYGFGVPTDPSAGDAPSATDVVLSQCHIQVGAAAHDSVFATSWPTSAQTDKGLSCFFGGN
ncbi:MAG: hypothetical protein ABIO06_02180 [Pseudolysinimonas sp.]